MANEIKDLFSTSTPFSITLSGLAGNSGQVGRQAAFVDNSNTRYQRILIFSQLQQSGTVTGSKGAYYYGLRGDAGSSQNYRSDGAVTGDAALTLLNAQLIGTIGNKSSAAAGDSIYGEFIFDTPGPSFSIAIYQDMASVLSNATGNNYIRWLGVDPEIQ